jgi:hypothetical protein
MKSYSVWRFHHGFNAMNESGVDDRGDKSFESSAQTYRTVEAGANEIHIDQIGVRKVCTIEIGVGEVRTAEVSIGEVCPAEIWRNGRPVFSPRVPHIHSLIQNSHMGSICHSLNDMNGNIL